MKHALWVTAALALAALAGVFAYQSMTREREYRLLLAEGDAAVARDQSFGAIENYSGAIALRPDSMLAHLRRGQTYRQRGDLGDAARDFRTASRLDAAATRPLEEWADVLYAQKRFTRAAEIYERRLTLDGQSPEVTFRLALARFRAGDCDAALAAIDRTLRLDPARADAYYLMGLCYEERHQRPAALSAFENAVQRSPGLIAAREELADLYATAGRHNEALEQMQLIAALERDQIGRQVAVGVAHGDASHAARDIARQERQANLAILTLGSVLERVPDYPSAYRALGEVWLHLAQSRGGAENLHKAIEALARPAAVPAAPSLALALYGRALLLNHQTDAAERVLQQAITRFPVEPQAFLDYAVAAARQHHPDAARSALLHYGALSAGDDSPERALRIGDLSLQLRDPVTAVAWLTRAQAARPDDPRIETALAIARQRLSSRSVPTR